MNIGTCSLPFMAQLSSIFFQTAQTIIPSTCQILYVRLPTSKPNISDGVHNAYKGPCVYSCDLDKIQLNFAYFFMQAYFSAQLGFWDLFSKMVFICHHQITCNILLLHAKSSMLGFQLHSPKSQSWFKMNLMERVSFFDLYQITLSSFCTEQSRAGL